MERFLYLSSIFDLFNGEILAYMISDCQNIDLVLDTLHQLPNLPEGCLLHSDQGSVYTSATARHSFESSIHSNVFHNLNSDYWKL